MAAYLLLSSGQFDSARKGIGSGLSILFFVLAWLGTALSPDRAHGSQVFPLAPRWSGVAAVVLTGAAAAFSLTYAWPEQKAALGAVATAAFAVLVWRFATAQADAIGEARHSSVPPQG